MFPLKFGRTKSNEQKKVAMEAVNNSNVDQPDNKQSSGATCARSLFSGLSLHTEVVTPANKKAMSHMDDLQDLSFPVNPPGSSANDNGKMTEKGTSRFDFINRRGVTDTSERQTSCALLANPQTKVKKTSKAKRFGQQIEETSSETSETKEERSSFTSDNSDVASLISDGSDLASQSSQQSGFTQSEGTGTRTERDKFNSLSEETSNVMPIAADKVTGGGTSAVMGSTDNEANALSIVDSNRMVFPAQLNSEDVDFNSEFQTSRAYVSASEKEGKSSEFERDSLDRLERCATDDYFSVTNAAPSEQDENSVAERSSLPNSEACTSYLQPEAESSEHSHRPLNSKDPVVLSLEENQDESSIFSCTDQISGSGEQILPEGCHSGLRQADEERKSKSDMYNLELDDLDKMELSLQTLEGRLNSIKEDRDSLTRHRTLVLNEVRGSLLARSRLLCNIQTMRSQQLDAVERDDFDEAERLNHQLEEAIKVADENTYRHPLLEPKITDLILTFNKMLLDHEREYNELLEEYGVVACEQKQTLKAVSESARQDKARRRNDLMKERSELERSLNHITLDKEYCLKQEQEIQSMIQERTSTLNQERADLQLEKQLVEKEIAELKEQLSLLEAKEDALGSSLCRLDGRIDEVKAEFANQLAAIAKEEKEIKEKESILDHDLETLEAKEKKLQNEDATEDGRLTKLENLARTLTEKIENVAALLNANNAEPTELTELVDLDCFKLVSNEELIKKKKRTETLGKEVKGLTSQVLQSRQAAANARKELTLLESEINEVKRAKELAVSERKFQDAKALAATLNSLTMQANCIKEDMENSAQKATHLAKTLNTVKPDYDLCQADVLELEKSRDEEYIRQLASATSRLGDFIASQENTLWISPILELQIELCQVIGNELSKQHAIDLPPELTTLKLSSPHCEEVDINIGATIDTTQLSKEIEELETRLNDAVQKEDFDEADEINQEIEKLRRKIDQTLS